MMKKNATFSGGEPALANACVGNNGSVGFEHYAKGFSQSANMLIDQALSDLCTYPVDFLIYPVCFNMRHSVELRLKGAIQSLINLAAIRGQRLEFDLTGSHDIGRIWDFFKKNSEGFDNRYKGINDQVSPTIQDIAEVDATGQTFRYPYSIESQKHLVDVSVINFLTLKTKFNALEKNLDRLLSLSEYLTEEYSRGSFTKNLSRAQLFQLASELPTINKWREPSFKDKKNDLRTQLNISNNEFTKAINIIKNHYEMAPLIGISIELPGLDRDFLIWFFTQWNKYHHDAKEKTTTPTVTTSGSLVDNFFERLAESHQLKAAIWEDTSAILTPEYLAGLETMFYHSNEIFSEIFTSGYKRALRNANVIFKAPENTKGSFMHLLDKTNCFSNILKGLFFLHHEGLAIELIERFDFEGVYHWQKKAETRELFELPAFAYLT
ncbi:hypothetical protein [Shewanella nanhaiensis]|uniref:Uncharacterized protein n=1 Tax=Shewanella nanhaiensis TaxID=2864872 RepID=A0ABS7EAX8_9GAMM|nr:hypothetical protein [Shewanella nanhaiensis]MBW8186207.1 hypothetical protein [Shewanella nanhaiensis]